MFTVIVFALGAFVGWNIPQPQFIKNIQTKVLGFFKK